MEWAPKETEALGSTTMHQDIKGCNHQSQQHTVGNLGRMLILMLICGRQLTCYDASIFLGAELKMTSVSRQQKSKH